LALRPFAKGRLICVFGCGGDRDRGKRPIMGRIAVTRADVVIVLGGQVAPDRTRPYNFLQGRLDTAAALVAASRGAPGFFAREELAVRQFTGAGITLGSVLAALVYGGIQTGLTEELVFRGLIGGSLGRRLPLPWANLGQALVFSLLHLPALLVAPELWPMMAAVAAVALFMGWLRLRSGSILGPWMVHAAANVTTALIAAAQSTM